MGIDDALAVTLQAVHQPHAFRDRHRQQPQRQPRRQQRIATAAGKLQVRIAQSDRRLGRGAIQCCLLQQRARLGNRRRHQLHRLRIRLRRSGGHFVLQIVIGGTARQQPRRHCGTIPLRPHRPTPSAWGSSAGHPRALLFLCITRHPDAAEIQFAEPAGHAAFIAGQMA